MVKHEGVDVEENNERGGFVVRYDVKSPRGKRIWRKFFYTTSSSSEEKKQILNESFIAKLLLKILTEKTDAVIWAKKPSEIKSELVHLINKINKSTKKGKLMDKYGWDTKREKREEVDDEESGRDPKRYEDPQLPSKSIFACEKESANTKVFLAPSFSGKTTLMVDELNKLSRKELEEFDKILLFTESTSAAPLKKLDKKVRAKMMIYDRFVPQFIRVLKKINTVTNNRYRFLLLLDDCINLKGEILIKLILTLRNVNISTVISIQYSKLLSRSQRQSIHDYFMINMKLEDLEYLMSGFLASHFRDLFVREGMGSPEEINKLNYKRLAEKAMGRLKDKILHFDQRHDKVMIYSRPKHG